VLLAVGLLPMTIQQFASLNYDALHISLCLLFIAAVTRLANAPEESITTRQLAWLSLVGVLAFNVKFGYVGLALLVFMLPAAKFGSRGRYWLFTTGFLAANAAVFFVAYRFFTGAGGDGSGGMPGVDSSGQALHVAGAPSNFLLILANSLYVDVHFYMETFLFKPGWLIQSMPPLWYLLLLAGMFVLLKNESEPIALPRRQRYVLLLTFLVNFLTVFFALYIGWTKVGQGRIEGVQGRYLLAVAPLLILFFYKAGFTYRSAFVRRHLHALLVCFYLAVFAAVFAYTYKIFYDKRPEVSLPTKIGEKLLGR
jgi:uncharacterized membrane protein